MVSVNTVKLNNSVNALLNSIRALPTTATPNVQRALDVATSYVQGEWVGAVSGQRIPGLSRTLVSKSYMASIKTTRIAPLVRMVYTDSQVADYIEYGHGEIDMKAYLPFKRSYRAKEGHYYSIIPFRHNVKTVSGMGGGVVGRQIYNEMRNMEKSFVVGSRIETQQRGSQSIQIKRAEYKWGGRMTGLKERYGAVKHIGRLEGMVRMETTTGQSKGSSAYLTFRVISQKSKPSSWIIPAQMGLPISKAVAKNVEGKVAEILQAGIERDLKGMGA